MFYIYFLDSLQTLLLTFCICVQTSVFRFRKNLGTDVSARRSQRFSTQRHFQTSFLSTKSLTGNFSYSSHLHPQTLISFDLYLFSHAIAYAQVGKSLKVLAGSRVLFNWLTHKLRDFSIEDIRKFVQCTWLLAKCLILLGSYVEKYKI